MAPFVFAAFAAALLAAAPARTPSRTVDVLDRFHTWFERLKKGKESLENRPEGELRTMISDLRTTWAIDPVRETDIACALLDFMGWCAPAANVLGAQSRANEARELSLE